MADMSIFSILNTGVLGTYTAKLAMSVTAHNISNTNTPGYSRQRAEIVATAPMGSTSLTQPNSNLTLGTGSMVKRVERVRDQFLDTQYRVINENHSFWDNMSANLHYMEQLLNEPAENGFREYFDKMWFSFQEVMSNPTNEASIQSVKSEVNNFISTFQDLYGRFEELRMNLNTDIKDTVSQINTINTQIGNLNAQIRMSYIADSEPNDILDERDKLLDELNKYANTTIKKGELGHLEVYIGQQVVIHGDQVTAIKSAVRPETLNTYDLFVRSTKIDVQKGKLGALMELRDVTIPAFLDKYDEMALMMADKLNLIHQAGYDKSGKISGINLFKEMEQTRTSLPNLFRMAGTNAILNGPIHMASSEISTNPSGTSLGISGDISFVDLNNYLFDKAISTDAFQTNKKFEEVIDELNQLSLYSTYAKDLFVSNADSVVRLEHFDTYDGGASVFYRTSEQFTSADDGIIKIPDLIDIDGDGQYLSRDIEIFDNLGNQYEDFTYEISTGIITVNGLPNGFDGDLIVNRWKNEQLRISDGVISYNELMNKILSLENQVDVNSYNSGTQELNITETSLDAQVFYVDEQTAPEFVFSAGEGTIEFDGKAVDINNDGIIDLDDLRIRADGTDVDDFQVTYNFDTDQTTIFSEDLKAAGTVTIRRWASDTYAFDGSGNATVSPQAVSLHFTNPTATANDFKVFKIANEDDIQVFIKTMRSDVRRSTDLSNTPTGKYSMMFGRVDDGIDQYGVVDEEKVNSLGDLSEMLVLDNKGILERLGFNTKVQSFLKIADFSYDVETYERDGLYGTWWLDGFVNETNMGLTGSQIEILDDSGALESDFNDSVHVFYVAQESLKAVHLESGGFKLENLVDINDDQQITSADISIRIDTDSDGVPDTILADGEFTYDSESEQIKLTDPVYENYNGTIVMDFRRWHKSYEDFASGTFDTLNLPKPAVSLDFSGAVDITDFRLYKEPIVNIPQEIPDPDDLKSISFTVPVEQSNGSTVNRTYSVEFYNKKELVTKINNNLDLKDYIKAFEYDGDFYISSKGSLEDISNVVVNDEYNLLSSVDLKVLNIGSYDTLNNIMYSYNEAFKGDYEFDNFSAPDTVDLKLKQNLEEYNGKVQVKYAYISDNSGLGYSVTDAGSYFYINTGTFGVKDTNQDGRIDREDIKLFDHTTHLEITDFVYDNNDRLIKLKTNPGNVDIVSWREESFDLNGESGTTYGIQLSNAVAHYDNPDFTTLGNLVDVSEDFFLSVQLPPDQMQMTLGTTDIDVSLNTTTLESLIEQINNKVPAGIISDLTPDNKLVFRAGTSADFSFGRVLEDGRIVQIYGLEAPTLFWEKMGYLGFDGTFGGAWKNNTDVVNNYLNVNALLHNQVSSNNLNIDGRQANGLYDFTKRLDLSSQIESNPLLLAVDYGRWTDLDGDWVADLHTPRGGSNVSSTSIISRLSEARYELMINDGNTSFVDFFGTFVSEMGIEAQTAMRMTSNNQMMLTQIDNERERVKGVSLDEEMSNMIKYQQAFNAAARVVTAVDEMIQRIIDGLGIVGR